MWLGNLSICVAEWSGVEWREFWLEAGTPVWWLNSWLDRCGVGVGTWVWVDVHR